MQVTGFQHVAPQMLPVDSSVTASAWGSPVGGLLLDEVALSGFRTASPPELSGEALKVSRPLTRRRSSLELRTPDFEKIASFEFKCNGIKIVVAK